MNMIMAFVIVFHCCVKINFFHKKQVYKQLALGQQITKQLSGLKLLSLSNSKNYRSMKSGIFPF